MKTRFSIYSATGENISWALIIVSTVIAYGLYWHGWQFSDRIVNGLFKYGYPASLILAVLIYGCFHDQCIIDNSIIVETYGYFRWRKQICVKIADVDIMYIISDAMTNTNDVKTKNGTKYVWFKLKDGSRSDDFTLCDRTKMVTKIQNLNKQVTVVFINKDENNG